MKYFRILFLISALIIFASACKETPTDSTPVPFYPLGTTQYEYKFGYTDSLWNFTSNTEIIIVTFPSQERVQNVFMSNLFINRLGFPIPGCKVIFFDNLFEIFSRGLLPFVDTTDTKLGFNQLNVIRFKPFDKDYYNQYFRDTTQVELYFDYKEMLTPSGTKQFVLAPAMFIQEWKGKSNKTNKDFTINNEKHNATGAQIFFNRIIKPTTLQGWKFIRPSNDPSLDEFYLDNDNTLIADKIEMTFYYKYKIGFLEILCKHRTPEKTKYYKWELTRIKD